MIKRVLKYGGMIVCAVFILFLVSIPIVNNYTAKAVCEHLKNIPLPQNTELIESVYGAGKYIGNGNGMQYLGCILLESDLPVEELRSWYASYADSEWECLVEEQRGQDIAFIEHGNMAFDTELSHGKYYIVYSWGEGIAFYSEWDIRGH